MPVWDRLIPVYVPLPVGSSVIVALVADKAVPIYGSEGGVITKNFGQVFYKCAVVFFRGVRQADLWKSREAAHSIFCV